MAGEPTELTDDKLDGMDLDALEKLARGDGETSEPIADKPATEPVVKPAEPEAKPAAEAKPAGKEAAAAVPEGAADEEADGVIEVPDPKGGQTKKTVSYAKYNREKKALEAERDRLAKETAELREKFARGDERLRLLAEVMQPAADQQPNPEDEDPEPDPQVDIFAHNAWLKRDFDRKIAALQQQVGQVGQTVQESEADRQLRTSYQGDAVAFARENPDFMSAYQHLLNTRAATLNEQGYSEQEIKQILFNEERGLVERAVKTGKRPAAMIYALSKQFGYRKAETPPSAAGNGAPAANGQNGNGGAAPKPSVTEELERLQAGMAGSRTLGGSGGGADEFSAEMLANMSESEFAAVYAKRRADVDRAIGARRN